MRSATGLPVRPPPPAAYRSRRLAPTPWPPPRREPLPLPAPQPLRAPQPEPYGWAPVAPAESARARLNGRTVLAGIAAYLGATVALGPLLLLFADTDTSDRTLLLIALAGQIALDLVGFVWLPYVLLGGGRPAWSALGLRRPTWRTGGWALLALAGSIAVLTAYPAIVGWIGADHLDPTGVTNDDTLLAGDHALLAMVAVLALAFAPLTEEIFFRGFLFGGLRPRWRLIGAALISGFIFSAGHLQLSTLIPFTLVGVIFALVYARSQNLCASVAAHFAFNAIAITAFLVEYA
jgi:membrane protease YdiL (CAAX protease family)